MNVPPPVSRSAGQAAGRPTEGLDLKYVLPAGRRNWGRGWARKESPQNFKGKCCKETSGGASFSSGLHAPFFFFFVSAPRAAFSALNGGR